jgi:hypothetical protein
MVWTQEDKDGALLLPGIEPIFLGQARSLYPGLKIMALGGFGVGVGGEGRNMRKYNCSVSNN